MDAYMKVILIKQDSHQICSHVTCWLLLLLRFAHIDPGPILHVSITKPQMFIG